MKCLFGTYAAARKHLVGRLRHGGVPFASSCGRRIDEIRARPSNLAKKLRLQGNAWRLDLCLKALGVVCGIRGEFKRENVEATLLQELHECRRGALLEALP